MAFIDRPLLKISLQITAYVPRYETQTLWQTADFFDHLAVIGNDV